MISYHQSAGTKSGKQERLVNTAKESEKLPAFLKKILLLLRLGFTDWAVKFLLLLLLRSRKMGAGISNFNHENWRSKGG
jgi:hypothetical protein